MKAQFDEFTRRATALLNEPGILEKRPAWQIVKAGAISLAPVAENAVTSLEPEIALIFLLASTFTGSKRDSLLKSLFGAAMTRLPSDNFIRLMSKFSQAELKDNLLPFVYESGPRGSVACFVAARLKVTLATEAFQYFLSARAWSPTDLMNLSLLVKPEEASALCSHLEKFVPANDSKVLRDNINEFRYAVQNHLAHEPMLPEIADGETSPPPSAPARAGEPMRPPQPAPVTAKPLAPISQSTPSVSAPIQTNRAETAAKPNLSQKIPEALPTEVPAEKSEGPGRPAQSQPQSQAQAKPKSDSLDVALHIPESIRRLLLPVGLTMLFLTLGIIYSTWYFSDPEVMTSTTPATAGRAPSQWVDAVSQRPVTAKYLAADKDFRMGELFLTRDKFAEALKLFEDALAAEPAHLQALVRSGYCRMQLGDNKKAAEIFRRALSADAGLSSVNLYLGRIHLAAKDNAAAEKHFRAEFKLSADLTSGMELANFLNRAGKQNEAMELIAELQEKHPGKMLVLAPTGSENKPERGGDQP